MLPSRIPQPWPFRLLSSAGGLLESAGLYRVRFEETAVFDAASRMSGLNDFGNEHFREGLRKLLEAEDMAPMHPAGRIALFRFTVFNLANRLRFVDAQKRRPELFEEALQPPLIVTGLPRSGTTFLHRLLALDPSHRAIPRCQMLPILIPHEARLSRWQRLITNHQFRFYQGFMSDIDRKHYTRADSPEECIWMLGLTFESTVYWVLAPLYEYLEWYSDRDRFPKYREYRLMLQLLQSANPRRRLVLKAPEHMDALDALLCAVPNGRIVQTHRNPVVVCSSLNSLLYTTHGAGAPEMEVPRMSESNVRMLETAISRNMAARETHPNRICDIRYDRLLSDPIGTIRDIYHHFEMYFSEEYLDLLRAYAASHPKDEHGRHRYSAEDFGQSAAELARRFAAYRERFEV